MLQITTTPYEVIHKLSFPLEDSTNAICTIQIGNVVGALEFKTRHHSTPDVAEEIAIIKSPPIQTLESAGMRFDFDSLVANYFVMKGSRKVEIASRTPYESGTPIYNVGGLGNLTLEQAKQILAIL